MSQVELIWGAFSVMLLGALLSMCMKCQRTGGKQKESSLDTQRNLSENPQEDEATHSSKNRLPVSKASSQRIPRETRNHLLSPGLQSTGNITKVLPVSVSRQDHANMLYDERRTSKNHQHHLPSRPVEAALEPRYQNFRKGSQVEQDAMYVDPISSDYFCNSEILLRQISDEDAHSYENVEPSKNSVSAVVDMTVYENSAAIQLWKHECPPENPDDDGGDDDDPDYVNADPNSRSW